MPEVQTTMRHVRRGRVGCEQVLGMPLKGLVGMDIAVLAEQLDVPARGIEKARMKKVEEHSRKDEEGNPLKLEDGSYDLKNEIKFNDEWEEMLDQEITVDVILIDPNKLLERAKCPECGEPDTEREIPGSVFYNLGPFLKKDVEKADNRGRRARGGRK